MPIIPATTRFLATCSSSSTTATNCLDSFQVAKSIIVFFFLNIFAHALTRLESGGMTAFQAFCAAVFRVVSPVYSRSSDAHVFRFVLSAAWKRWVEYGHTRGRPRGRPWDRLNYAIRGKSKNPWPLQAALDAGVIVIRDQECYRRYTRSWRKVNLDSIWSKRHIMTIGGEFVDEPVRYVYIPSGAKFIPESKLSKVNIRPSGSSLWIPTTVAVGQLVYSCFDLWQTDFHEIRHRGLASPFVVIIPYIVMSFANLVIDVTIGTYPLTFCLTSSSPNSRVSTPDKEHVNPSFEDFQQWLKNTYDLEVDRNVALQSQIDAWSGVSGLIHLIVSYGIITLILFSVSKMRVVDPVTATSSLLWIYDGVPCYLLLCVLRLIFDKLDDRNPTRDGGWYDVFESSPWVVVIAVALGPVIWGSVNVTRALVEVYSGCTTAAVPTTT